MSPRQARGCQLAAVLLIAASLWGSTVAARVLLDPQSEGSGDSHGDASGPHASGGVGVPGDGIHSGGSADANPLGMPPLMIDVELISSASKLAAQLVDPDSFTVVSSGSQKPKLTACNTSVAILGALDKASPDFDMAPMADGAIVMSTGDVLRVGPPMPMPLPTGAMPGDASPYKPMDSQQQQRGRGGRGGPHGWGDSQGPRHPDASAMPDDSERSCADIKSSAIPRSHDAVTLELHVKAKKSGILGLSALFMTEEGAPWADQAHKSGVKADDTLHIEVDGTRLERLLDGGKVTSSAMAALKPVGPVAAMAVTGVAGTGAAGEPGPGPHGQPSSGRNASGPHGQPHGPGGGASRYQPSDGIQGHASAGPMPGDMPPDATQDHPVPLGAEMFAAAVAPVGLEEFKIERGKVYHIIIRIADVGDRNVDSSVSFSKHGLAVVKKV